jgi:hypothetical protein
MHPKQSLYGDDSTVAGRAGKGQDTSVARRVETCNAAGVRIIPPMEADQGGRRE